MCFVSMELAVFTTLHTDVTQYPVTDNIHTRYRQAHYYTSTDLESYLQERHVLHKMLKIIIKKIRCMSVCPVYVRVRV